MPYIGVQRESGQHKVTVKLHGPLDRFPIAITGATELKETIDKFLLQMVDVPTSALPKRLADSVCEKYADGDNIVWVEVGLITNNDVLYGASAEMLEMV